MSWRKAHSLTTLLDQFNTACPYRSKKSDGFIGDENHKHRFSYHNPDRSGIVPAGDFTHDPARGMDIDRITDELAASRDSRILELIANGMYLNRSNWKWVKYTGPNPHDRHFHISVVHPSHGGDDRRLWKLPMFDGTATPRRRREPRTTPSSRPEIKQGSQGRLVKELQKTPQRVVPQADPAGGGRRVRSRNRSTRALPSGPCGTAEGRQGGTRTGATLGYA